MSRKKAKAKKARDAALLESLFSMEDQDLDRGQVPDSPNVENPVVNQGWSKGPRGNLLPMLALWLSSRPDSQVLVPLPVILNK